MKLVALLAAGFVTASTPALAQYYGPRPMAPIGPSSAEDVADIVQAVGLRPIGPPARSGRFYVQTVRDDFGRVLRVTVDAERSRIMTVGYGAPRALYGLEAGYVPQYSVRRGPLAYPEPDFGFAPPGSIMGARLAPNMGAPQAGLPPAVHPKPATKSAAVTPKEPPVPRKRPSSAPQEAAGSVEPLQASPQPAAPAPEPQKPTPPDASEKPANAMPPVTPLE